MSRKILISYPFTEDRIKALNSPYEVACVGNYKEALAKIEDYDAWICMGQKADKTMMDKGSKLKVISNYGVGYDNVDVAYAKEKGIAVTNLPRSTSAPTADMALTLMLSLLLKVSLHDRWLRAGNLPTWNLPKNYGNSPGGKKLGIVGMGRIGKELAKRGLALGMEILYFKRNRLSEAEEKDYQAHYLGLEELLKEADVLSLHTPLNESTFHLIGQKEIALMKSSAVLINTARGNVVDNDALISALQSKQIAGAGLDVFPNEPEVPEAYLHMDHVVLAPHAGTATFEARNAMFEEAFQNALDVLEGKVTEARVV